MEINHDPYLTLLHAYSKVCSWMSFVTHLTPNWGQFLSIALSTVIWNSLDQLYLVQWWGIPSPVTSICGKTDRYILVLNYCAFQQVSIQRNFQIFLPAKQYTILQIFVYVYALLERCTITKPILICIYSMMWYILRFFFKHTNSQHTNTQHTYTDTKKTKQAILVQQICIQEKISH